MTWLVFAVVAPFLWAAVSYLDKFALGTLLAKQGIRTYMVLEALVTMWFVLFLVLFVIDDLFTHPWHTAVIFLGGLCGVAGFYTYFRAIKRADPTAVVPLFQLVPVFAAPIAWILLGEVLTTTQLLAAGSLVFGGYVISLRHSLGRIWLDTTTLALMGMTAVLFATTNVLFKLGTDVYPYWDAVAILRSSGLVAAGLFLVSTTVRSEVTTFLTTTSAVRLTVVASRTVLGIMAALSFYTAVLAAPVALVQSVSGLQPLFALLFGLGFWYYRPGWFQERFDAGNLAFKLIGTTAIMTGLALLLL